MYSVYMRFGFSAVIQSCTAKITSDRYPCSMAVFGFRQASSIVNPCLPEKDPDYRTHVRVTWALGPTNDRALQCASVKRVLNAHGFH